MTVTLAAHLRERRVAVALSSAFFGFFAHTGFLRALEAAGVAPVAFGGTSAGAMAAAFAGADRLDRFQALITSVHRRDFWDPSPRLAPPVGLLKGRLFEGLLRDHLPSRFEDCPTPVITVSTNLTTRGRQVDTRGDLPLAVLASSALPILFHPVRRGPDLHVDGGLLDKVPGRAMWDHGPPFDVLLVHQIPSAGLERPVARSPMRFVDQALDWVRADAWGHQAAALRALGVEIVEITSRPPARPNPFRLDRGLQALAAAHAGTAAALAAGHTVPRQ
ncbi:MAG: patatin-like phospholipase family protein [Myxococcales bacterium]|nr:patatin-like phospholipase family protein [Myxococcales bacterium]MCB9525653.1 patatin-like phospholipase family protein [Myxococcales bacterium]